MTPDFGPVLVVEDDAVIGMDVQATLNDMGFPTVHLAETAREALDILEQAPVMLALLDVLLREGNSFPIAETLAMRGVPFLMVTAYDELDAENVGGQVPECVARAPRIGKPYASAHLHAAIVALVTSVPARAL